MDYKMFKYHLTVLALVLCSTVHANPYETRTYSQPPVNTEEFIVEQADQVHLANLTKDTETIEIESDFLGIKQFKRDTFDITRIKERFNNGFAKLRQDDKTVQSNKHQY